MTILLQTPERQPIRCAVTASSPDSDVQAAHTRAARNTCRNGVTSSSPDGDMRVLHRSLRLRTVQSAVIACAVVVGATACGRSLGTPPSTTGPLEIKVAAASDLRPAFEELGEKFRQRSGINVVFSFGSSGQLREQILNGAPFDLFASANVEFVDEVIGAGRGIAETKADYALGRIVLWTPAGVAPPARIEDLTDARFGRIAIANPEHAPYGLAAQQALHAAGIYAAVAPKLVYGENIADTFRIAQSGNAEVAIVALSLAVAFGGDYMLVPADLHQPLEQALVVTSRGPSGERARKFASFISSPEGREVMTRYGFVVPDEPAPEQVRQ
ncbi:MAG: molybdate ABC transporter substrate-binding protein [Acidimicrobiales bacterium]|nr:molybdate ABC transporter substrate-binding protein [Acidimicrobiales bacterium]